MGERTLNSVKFLNPIVSKLRVFGLTIGPLSFFYSINIFLGIGRDSFLAAKFGASEQLDIFYLAYNTMRTLGMSFTGAFVGSMVPIYVSMIYTGNRKLLLKFSYRWFKFSIVLLSSISLFILSFPNITKWLAPGFSEVSDVLLQKVIIGLIPLLLIMGFAGNLKAISDSLKLYITFPFFLGLITLGVIIGCIFSSEINGLVVGAILGSIMGVAFQIIGLFHRFPKFRTTSIIEKISYNNSSNEYHLPIRSFTFLWLSSLIVLIQGIVEFSFVSRLSPGTITQYNIALSVVGVPSTLLLPAISSVVLPKLAQDLAFKREKRYGFSADVYSMLVLGFIGITAAFWIGSEKIVSVLFGHGKFSVEAVHQTAYFVRWLSLSFVTYVIGVVLRQIIFAQGKTALDLIVTVSILAIKTILLCLFVPIWGVAGVIFEMLISSILTVIFYLLAIRYSQNILLTL